LICIPGHDGILLGLQHLARLLPPDQPVYGLAAPQPTAFPGEAWNIQSFAAHYADALVGRFPDRGVHLAGICFGGVVAYELARQLERRGTVVQSLILMDTLNPGWKRIHGSLARLSAYGRMICERVEAHVRNMWMLGGRGSAEYVSERTRAFIANRRDNGEVRRMRRAVASAEDSPERLRRVAMSNYQPGPYAGPVAMIRVRGFRPHPPVMGWRGIATGKVSMVSIDFCPRGIVAEPAVSAIARLVSGIIG
jgi:thioesterase domain-containing protein